MVNKEKLMKEVNETTEITNGKKIEFKILCYIILKILELKEKGLTTEHFKKEMVDI